MEGAIQAAPMEQWKNIVATELVHPTRVGEYVEKGWVILMAYMSRVDIPDQVWNPSGNYAMNTTKQVYEPVVLMGQTNIDKLNADLIEAKATADRLQPYVQKCETLTRENATLADTSKVLAEAKTALLNDLSTERTRYWALHAANVKLEDAIGKIRSALGDIRMKEILGDGATGDVKA